MITFERAFHGRTLMAMSLTSKQHPYKAGMGPFAPEVYRAPYPYPYRDDSADPAAAALAELREMFTTHVAAENVAAIIFEPVQGEGGFVVPPAEWVRGLREIADEHGIVLIADEVQSGYGRTGKHVRGRALRRRARPDHRRQVDRRRRAHLGRDRTAAVDGRAPATAPSAAPTSARRWAAWPALAVLDEIEQPRPARARHARSASGCARGSRRCRRRHPQIGDVRGLGPMLAAEFVARPGHEGARARAGHGGGRGGDARGLLILKAGMHGNCLRVLVSLVATDEQIDEIA